MKKVGLVLIALVIMLSGCQRADYNKANEKTSSMTDYAMDISTIVTIEDGDSKKQSAIDQTVAVNNKGKKDMIYKVGTVATSADIVTGDVESQENSYMYYGNCYYYTYPGVRYKSTATHEQALENIDNLTNVITFSEDEMLVTGTDTTEEGEVISYQVDYEDTSLYVKSLLENAATAFEGVSFSPVDMIASTSFDKNSIVSRELYVEYAAEGDKRITIEIYVTYSDAAAVEKPDKSKYASIEG